MQKIPQHDDETELRRATKTVMHEGKMSLDKLMENYTHKEWDSGDESDESDGGWETTSEAEDNAMSYLDTVEPISPAPQPEPVNIFIGPGNAIPAGFA